MGALSSEDYEQFKKSFMRLTGIDLSLYKEEQMKRRLKTLLLKRQMSSFKMYYEHLCRSQEMLEECLNRITINVTEFFRNRPRWEVLENKLSEAFAAKRRLTVWSAACSTGEEPYSIAMMLAKHLPLDNFSIIATDVDRQVLKKAEEGRYSERALASLTLDEKQRFFQKDGPVYAIGERLKKTIVFKYNNLLSDPAPGQFDVIVCRNVLIYFTEEGKQTIYQKMARALKEGGILFVGSTEQIFHPENYALKSAETFFYEKTKAEGLAKL